MCGIVGVVKLSESSLTNIASPRTYLSDVQWTTGELCRRLLNASSNRGDQGVGQGYLTKDGEIATRKFSDPQESSAQDFMRSYDGSIITGHARYGTSGNLENPTDALQPFICKESVKGGWEFQFSFNGTLINTNELTIELENEGYNFKLNGLDTEVVQNLISRQYSQGQNELREIVRNVINKVDGACNISLSNKDGDLIIAVDKNGYHPLAWSVKDGVFVYASESSALESIGCEDIRYLQAGQAVEVRSGHIYTYDLDVETDSTPCALTKVYFGSPESTIDGKSVAKVRASMGRRLAQEVSRTIDINKENFVVVHIPESSYYQNKGFAEYLELKSLPLIIKHPYASRTFISQQKDIEAKIKAKYIFSDSEELMKLVQGKEVLLIDDSVVRGNTSEGLISVFREIYLPNKVHMISASPPVIAPCYTGMDIPTIEELMIPQKVADVGNIKQEELDTIAHSLGADSLHYFSLRGLSEVLSGEVKMTREQIRRDCMACFTRVYSSPGGQAKYEEQKITFHKKIEPSQ